ncbi:MAG TPA: chromosome segregation protein SMC [Pseudogracilibacillus sp.]|nr:chromosome segregation protein SMC [Pseudogracilibacillus sp.]
MFLKQLDTVGFKSFAERAKVDFVSGVTAVVGPNGSGKSNIIDAVRWVLGEQSAKSLRGQKMEDIIFQGSETRNPLNYAEVALTMNNQQGQLPIEYDEVNVTRRVYRSGESEFYINKKSCRLKDIIDLFMDTGLGRESFSIIGQGRIDDILSSKAEDRRAIFEEAAGVLKYKQRKYKAEYKLTETTENLDRVEDIIHEIEGQIEPLREQAKKAKQYKEKKAALKEKEVALLVTEINQVHEKWQALLTEINRNKQDQETLEKQKNEYDARINQNRQKIDHLNEELETFQQSLLDITEKLEKTEGQKQVWSERFENAKHHKEQAEKNQKDSTNRLAALKLEWEKENETFQILKEKLQSCQAKMDKLRNNLSYKKEDIEKDIENKKSDYIEYLNEQAVLQNKKQAAETELKRFDALSEKKFERQQQLKTAEQEQKVAKESTIKQLENKKSYVQTIESALKTDQTKLQDARVTYQDMQKKLYEGNEQIAKLASRRDMLLEMRDAFQGYFNGVKAILQARQKGMLADIEGAVVDLLDVPSSYMTAIETVLGGHAQFIVVATDDAARRAISWLKQEKQGRATFLPLTSIRAKYIPNQTMEKIKEQEGFIGIASEAVQSNARYQTVREHLLGNVLIAKDLKAANKIAKLIHHAHRIVTLDGDMVFPGGSMSGGSKKKQQSSLFSREKEVQLLEEKLQRYEERKAAFEKKLNTQSKEVNQLEQRVTQQEKTVHAQKIELEEVQETYQDILFHYRNAAAALENEERAQQEKQREQTELKAQLAEVEAKQEPLQQTIKELDESIQMLTGKVTSFEEEEKQTEKQLHELEVSYASLQEQYQNKSNQLQQLTEQMDELKNQMDQQENELQNQMSEQELQTWKSQLENDIENYRTKRETTNQKVEEKRTALSQVKQQVEDDTHETKGVNKKLRQEAEQIQEKEIQANRLDVTLDNHLSILQSEYTMTFEKAASLYYQVTHIKSARDEVNRMKEEIKTLGTVNLGAIDEFERMNERYTFLKTQQDDLLEAKATLYSVIQEMDAELTTKFAAVFEEIQNAFTRVFEQLFGGGYAALKLTDPNNLLETGIDIIARPPGKKLKTLGLLSGGERALTAIALLFAILEVRPVPFCILDEVDAALDETNVDRFGKYLRSFSTDTQFIVITHRKGTMEEADALYGITMQESGVSRLVSVKLEDTASLVPTT